MEITETALMRLFGRPKAGTHPRIEDTLDSGPGNRPFPPAGFSVSSSPRPSSGGQRLPRGEFLGLAVGALWLLAALLA